MSEAQKLHRRLTAAVQRRNELRGLRQRKVGQLEAAIKRREELHRECHKKGIDPDQIEEVIATFQKVATERIEALEQQIKEAEEQLAPYL